MANAFSSTLKTTSYVDATSDRTQNPEASGVQHQSDSIHSCEHDGQAASMRSSQSNQAKGYDEILQSPRSRNTSPCETDSAASDRSADTASGIPAQKLLHLAPPIGTAKEIEYEPCCRSLEETFRRCDQLTFSRICCAISLVLKSSQRLQQDELSIAVFLVIARRQRLKPRLEAAGGLQHVLTSDWLQIADTILELDDSGFVCFRTASMGNFLRTFWIRGIDTSHRTVAAACLTQTEIDKASEMDQTLICSSLLTYKHSAFSSYASRYCEVHLLEAQKIGFSVEKELCQEEPSSRSM